MDIYVHLFSYPFSVILGKHSKMKLLGYSVTLSFTFWGSDEVLAQLAAPLCLPSSNVGRFSFKIYLPILITFQVIFYIVLAIHVYMKWYPVLMMYIFLMINDVEYLFYMSSFFIIFNVDDFLFQSISEISQILLYSAKDDKMRRVRKSLLGNDIYRSSNVLLSLTPKNAMCFFFFLSALKSPFLLLSIQAWTICWYG